jgi:hypothetical protein
MPQTIMLEALMLTAQTRNQTQQLAWPRLRLRENPETYRRYLEEKADSTIPGPRLR